jgi:hypothetical protein
MFGAHVHQEQPPNPAWIPASGEMTNSDGVFRKTI